jgi:hypothetical protein
VEVRESGTNIATLIRPPFQVNKTFAAGTHTLEAVVVDAFGVMSTSAPVTFRAAMLGDRFEHRTRLSGLPVAASGSNKLATREAGEPNHAGADAFASIWFEWAAPISGRSVSRPKTRCSRRGWQSIGNKSRRVNSGRCSGGTLWKRIEQSAVLDVVQGSTYMIALDSLRKSTGSFQLTINPVPGFDDLEFASVIGGIGSWSGSNIGSSAQVSEPAHDGVVGGRSVWWQWTAPSNGNYFAQTEGSTFNTVLAVYEGTSLETLRAVTANNDFGSAQFSRVVFSAVGERPYLLVVDGVNTAVGDIRLTIGPLDYPRLFARSILETEVILELQGEVGRIHRVEVSDDLATWLPVHTQTLGTASIVLSVSRSPGDSPRFYRAIQLP